MLNNLPTYKGLIRLLTEERLRMRMFSLILFAISLIQTIFTILSFFNIPALPAYPSPYKIYFQLLLAKPLSYIPFLNSLSLFSFKQYSLSASKFSFYFSSFFDYYNTHLFIAFKKSFFAWFLYPIIYSYIWYKTRYYLYQQHLRGSELISENKLSKIISKTVPKNEHHLSIKINNSLYLPYSCQPRHFLILGRPGAGKSQFFYNILQQLNPSGQKLIIYDFKGDYVRKFYNPKTDLIFNPLDQRTLRWNLFNELKTLPDIESLCHSVIPPGNTKEPFWENASRDILYSALRYCILKNKCTHHDLYKLSILNRVDLLALFESTPGLERGARPLAEEKLGNSVLSTFSQYVKFLEYLAPIQGNFSIKKWITDDQSSGRLFITNYAEISSVMQPLLSLFIDICATSLFMLTEDHHRRIYFFLDEFGTLPKINNIINLLKLSRSYGGSIWIGIQDIGQIENTYGNSHTKTIINSTGNHFIFSLDEPLTADFFSKRFGEKESLLPEETFSLGTHQNRDGQNISQRKTLERIVLPSDFMTLPDLRFYCKFAVTGHFSQSQINYKKLPDHYQSFLLNEDLIKISQEKTSAPPSEITQKSKSDQNEITSTFNESSFSKSEPSIKLIHGFNEQSGSSSNDELVF